MNVLVSAGEASGDAYAAQFITELQRLQPDATYHGIGGARLRALLGQLVADTSTWGAIGILQALKVVPRSLQGYAAAKRALMTLAPGLFVPIDFGFFNIRLCRIAKARGWTVLYFIPPGSWRRNKQGADLPHLTDAIATPFPWSAELLASAGARARFYGHPIKQLLSSIRPLADDERTGLALLPGSRHHEVHAHLPVMAEVARRTGLAPIVSVAPSIGQAELQRLWPAGQPVEWWTGTAAELLSRASVAVVCSGTATLEAAIMRCPSVVIYRGPKWMWLEFVIRRPKFSYFALPNILLQRMAMPEHLQDEANPTTISADLAQLQSGGRTTQLDAFDELDEILGPSDAITKTAEWASQLMTEHR